MAKAMERVAAEGCGIIVVILQEEPAEQVEEELEALFDRRERTIKASETVYLQIGAGSQILRDLGAQKIKVMSAPFRFNAISGFDLEVVEYIECP
jgi:3,4-dihydroxy 2-butanone 4-phosphate synthase/GTP cyclohydrolase II